MRIRKRQVPLPLSSLSPVPLSDPLLRNLNYSPPRSPPPPPPPPTAVVQQLHTHHDDRSPTQPKPPNSNNPVEETVHVGRLLHPQPSDHRLNQDPRSIRAGAPKGWGFSDNQRVQKKDCGLESLELKEEEEVEGGSQEADDMRNESILGAEALLSFASGPSSSSHRALERETIMDNEKYKRSIRTKTIKRCSSATQQHDHGGAKQDGDRVDNVVNGSNASAIRKRARISGAIMEGSRCSRVNGRGWRCCQPTLVGYSLCEHHLGKGRLRSMTSVRRQSIAATATASARIEVKRSSTSEEDTKAVALLDDRDIGEEIEIKPLMVRRRRRMKLGVVKARSMSSLLGQTNSAVAQVAYLEDENKINK